MYTLYSSCLGVKEASPLRFLPFFNLCWDVLPDMMHIGPGIWQRHIHDMLRNKRIPAPCKTSKNKTKQENATTLQRHLDCLAKLTTWKLTKVHI
jgi:hypothetical protein